MSCDASTSPLVLLHCAKKPRMSHRVSATRLSAQSQKIADDRQSTAGELAAQLRSAIVPGAEEFPQFDRTLPDIPHAESSRAHTRGAAEGLDALDTRADVNAPTLITVDSVSTSPPSTGLPPPSPARSDADRAAPAIYSPVADMGSSVTVQRAPAARVEQTVPKKTAGKSFVLVGAVALLLILAVVGVGGFFAINYFKEKPQPADPAKGAVSSTVPALSPVEVGRHWLEVLPDSLTPMRVAGAVPLRSGQAFKFHFVFTEGGYLYIVGPGDGNRPTAFLTLYPAEISGLTSNLVTKGERFQFSQRTGTLDGIG